MRILSRSSWPTSHSLPVRIAACLAIAGAFLLPPLPAVAEDAAAKARISLQGRGEVSVTPDMAIVTTRVVSAGKKASDTLNRNTETMTKVIADIEAAGVDEKDIQTSGFSIHPRYDHREDRRGQEPKIVGYEVSNGVTVRIRDLSKLGTILETVVSSGANSIDNIRFDVSDPAKVLDEARKAAVTDAKHKADLYAQALGVKLGPIMSVSEGGISAPSPYGGRMEKVMALSAAPVPVKAGSQTMSASVTIVWELTQ